LNEKKSISTPIAWGVAGVVALAGGLASTAQFGQTQQAQHSLSVAQHSLQKARADLKSTEGVLDSTRSDLQSCQDEAGLWKQAAQQEATDMAAWLADPFGSELTLDDATDSVNQAKAAGCLE